MNTRQRLLAVALVATLAVAFWPAGEDSVDVVESSRPSRDPQGAARAPLPAVPPSQRTAKVPAERLARMQGDLFPHQTWVPPPPKPKPYIPPPPPPPQPPALPYKYLGRWVDAGQETVFLVQGEDPVAIQVGQVLSHSWRVDEITERKVVFTYLPLDMQSILGITP